MRTIEKLGDQERWYFTSLRQLVKQGVSRKQARGILKPAYIIMITDQLTGVYNRRKLFMNLDNEVKLARAERPLSVIMLDLDNFKGYNDAFGHSQGDEALRESTYTIRETIGDKGILARYGGEEFTVILPNIDSEEGTVIAEEIRENIEKMVISPILKNIPERCKKITVSQGVTLYKGNPVKTVDEIIVEADIALYASKKAGRNRVSVYQDILF